MLKDTWGLGTDRDTVNPGQTSWRFSGEEPVLGLRKNVEKLSHKTQDSWVVQWLGLGTFFAKGLG